VSVLSIEELTRTYNAVFSFTTELFSVSKVTRSFRSNVELNDNVIVFESDDNLRNQMSRIKTESMRMTSIVF